MNRRSLLCSCGAAVPGALALGTGTSHGFDRGAVNDEPFEPLGSVDVPGAKDAVVHHDGEVAYVAATDGFAAVDLTDPADPTVLSEHRGIEVAPGEELVDIRDCWPDGDRLLVAGPATFDPDAPTGFALFDVGDPAAPEQVAGVATDYYIHNTFFDDGLVYLTATGLEAQPVVMYDASADDPVEVGRWSLGDYDEAYLDLSPGLRTIHDLYVQDEVAYLAQWDAGTWLLDVADPTDPMVLSSIGGYSLAEMQGFGTHRAWLEPLIPPGNHHYTQVNEDGTTLAIGIEAWARVDENGALGDAGELVGGPGGVELWDISDPGDPSYFATIDAPESYDQTQSGWFTTAHNIDIVDDRLYSSWYYGGVKIHDVSDPANPEERAWWRDPTEASFWTAQVGVPGEFFIASAVDLGELFQGLEHTRSALYVFPDRAGTQPDPPDLTDPPEGIREDPPDETDEDTQDTDSDGEAKDTDGANGEDDAADDDGPGFGVGVGIAALAGGAALAHHLREETDE